MASVPADFSAFAAARADNLRSACHELTRHGQLGDLLAVDLLARVALRWRWRPANRREPAGTALLRRLVRHEARSWPSADKHAGLITVLVDAPVSTPPFADQAWRQARSIRHTRVILLLFLVALAAGTTVLGRPPPGRPPPTPVAVADSAGVRVLPADLTTLEHGDSPLPPVLGESSVELTDQPVRRAVAVLRRQGGPLFVVSDEGTRRFNPPQLASAVLLSTSLSPDGTRVALPEPGGFVLIDLRTATVHSVPVATLGPMLVWRDPGTVVMAAGAGLVEVTVDNGATVLRDSVRADDLASGRGPDNPVLTELISPLASVSATPRIRMWHETRSEDLLIFGPPWIGSWTGPGWSTKDLLVRSCLAGAITLPTGPARSAVGALRRNGLYLATLVSADDTTLDILGFADPETILVAATNADTGSRTGTDSRTAVLAWTPADNEVTLISSVEPAATLSVSDLLTGPS